MTVLHGNLDVDRAGAAWRRRCSFIVRLFREKPFGAIAGLVFVLFVLCGVFADVLAPYGFNEIAPIERLRPPSWRHPFGTDNLGRDLLSRCLYGARLSVIIGFSAAALAHRRFRSLSEC